MAQACRRTRAPGACVRPVPGRRRDARRRGHEAARTVDAALRAELAAQRERAQRRRFLQQRTQAGAAGERLCAHHREKCVEPRTDAVQPAVRVRTFGQRLRAGAVMAQRAGRSGRHDALRSAVE
ncbi:hypothetical protein KPB01_18260, partial [Burkholderia sola]|nr:hypothetical protein [Burkholderia sola]